MRRFFFSPIASKAIAVHCVPRVEELESLRLLAVASASSILPPVQGPSLSQAQPAAAAALVNPAARATTPAAVPLSPTGQSALSSFSLPPSFFNPAAGPSGFPPGFSAAATTGAVPLPAGAPLSAVSLNALTPQQALAQRAVIFTPYSAPPPAYAYGEGMIIYVAPLDLTPPALNNPVSANESNTAVANVETHQPAEVNVSAQDYGAEWRDALDVYYASGGAR
jgi:hypothetical protein